MLQSGDLRGELFNLFCQHFDVQLHLLLTFDVLPTLAFELAQNLLVLFVSSWDGAFSDT